MLYNMLVVDDVIAGVIIGYDLLYALKCQFDVSRKGLFIRGCEKSFIPFGGAAEVLYTYDREAYVDNPSNVIPVHIHLADADNIPILVETDLAQAYHRPDVWFVDMVATSHTTRLGAPCGNESHSHQEFDRGQENVHLINVEFNNWSESSDEEVPLQPLVQTSTIKSRRRKGPGKHGRR